MRGIVPVISFAMIGGLVLAAGNHLATHPVWCGENATPGCQWMLAHDDIRFAIAAFGVGLVALLAISVIANWLLFVAGHRRPVI